MRNRLRQHLEPKRLQPPAVLQGANVVPHGNKLSAEGLARGRTGKSAYSTSWGKRVSGSDEPDKQC
jgi:hypothetical protein